MVEFELPTMIAFLLFCIGLCLVLAESRLVTSWKKSDKRDAVVHRYRLLQNLLH
ncbi:MAG TPA: hypothetical protein VGJ57_03145 [Nitrospirales bacterium]|jgi:hypothetical protein